MRTTTDPSRLTHTDHYVGLDGARFACAILVMLYHYCYWVRFEPSAQVGLKAAAAPYSGLEGLFQLTWFGHVGVDIFFVISGFVISHSILQRSLLDFAINRFLRIYPTIWVFSSLALAVAVAYSTASISQLLYLWVKSLVLFPVGPWLDGVYWSLCIEVAFYILVAAFVRRRDERTLKRLMYTLGGLSTAAACLTATAELCGLDGLRRLLLSYPLQQLLIRPGAAFALGIGLFLVFGMRSKEPRPPFLALLACSSALWIFLRSHYLPGDSIHLRLLPASLYLALLGIMVWTLHYSGLLRERTLLSRLFTRLGAATYPIYLLHNISGSFLLGSLVSMGTTPWVALLVTCLIVLVIAIWYGNVVDPIIRRFVAAQLTSVTRKLRPRALI